MNGFAIFLLVLIGIGISIMALIFGTWVYVWNINDIIAHGANFWNVFWIVLTSLVFFGGASKAAS